MGLTLSCLEAIPMDLCGFRLVWLQPRFVLFRCFLCWRNANLAGRFAGRRCCRVFSCCFGVSMMCLGCEAKEFHIYLHTFLPLLSLSERDRPQQRKKKSLCPCANTFCVRGVASARSRRASKRLDCRLWKHGTSFINIQKGKDCRD